MIKLQQDALTDTNKNKEAAVQQRNFLCVPPNVEHPHPGCIFQINMSVACSGIQLLEQDEVLLSYNNEVSAQDAAIAERNVELESAEKETRDLQLAVREEKRQLGLRKKEVLEQKWLEGEIASLQIEVGDHRHTQVLDDVQIKSGIYLHINVALISIKTKICFCSGRTNSKKEHTSG